MLKIIITLLKKSSVSYSQYGILREKKKERRISFCNSFEYISERSGMKFIPSFMLCGK